jgi:hypothetical protein
MLRDQEPRDDHHKTRICVTEGTTPFMDLRTPLEVLKVIYDLLEREPELH